MSCLESRDPADMGIGDSIAEEYNLELQYRKPFADVWKEEKDNRVFGPLSERMGVRDPRGGDLLVSEEEMEAVGRLTSTAEAEIRQGDANSIWLGFYHAFCFYKV